MFSSISKTQDVQNESTAQKRKTKTTPPKKVKSKDERRREGRDTEEKVPHHHTAPVTHHVGELELQERKEEERRSGSPKTEWS